MMKKYIVDRIEQAVALMNSNEAINNVAFRTLLNNPILLEVDNDDEFVTKIPFFLPGHPLEIENRLVTKGTDPINKWKKYPLVVLRMDIDENYRGDMVDYTLNIAILNETQEDLNAQQRIAQVFKPILHPLYEAFMEAIKDSGNFVWAGNQARPLHRKVDRPFWGNSAKNGNVDNIFSDPLDAVEIIDLRLSCYTC
jgi:hypothetical protein